METIKKYIYNEIKQFERHKAIEMKQFDQKIIHNSMSYKSLILSKWD